MREREVKMIVPDSFELPALHDAVAGASVGDVEQREISDVYYDTVDLRLARWGCTVRHRLGEGWAVKIPRPSKGRVLDREEVVFGGDPGEPPAAVLNLVSSLTRGADVNVVARLRTRRLARTWRTDDGVVIGELTDDDVRASKADGDEVAFREIEFELAPDADDDLVDEVAARLTPAIRSAERPIPKLVRALGPRAMEPPDVDVAPLPSTPTAQQVIQSAIASSVARLLLQLPAARLGVDPEGVHQARVAARRLRSDLKTFEPLLDSEWSAGMQAQLRWLIDELGAVRDSDIIRAKLRDVIERHPEIDDAAACGVFHQVRLKRRRDRRRLLRHLDDDRATELLDQLVAASAAPATVKRAARPARDVLPKLVRKRWKRLDRAINGFGRRPTAAELHEVRILAKRLRYAAEAVAPAAGKQAWKFAKDASRIQDALGELNDAAVVGAWLAATADRLDGPAAFSAGQMTQQLVIDAHTHERQWRSAHRALKRRTAWFSRVED
jgi:CHAD domain-containing protein